MTLALHIIRIVMLTYRISPANVPIGGVVFSMLGFSEAIIGIIRLFNFKKRLVKVGSYSSAKQKALLKQWKENIVNKSAKVQPDIGGSSNISRQMTMRTKNQIDYFINNKVDEQTER